jgi:hypothetical protein
MNAPTLTPAQRIARGVDFVAHTIGSSPARELEITRLLVGWVADNRELAQALTFPDLLAQLAQIADQGGFLTAEQRIELEKRVVQATRQRNRRLGKPWGSKVAS